MADTQKTFATVLGAILLLVGIIGLFNDPVLSLFDVNGLHNGVHIVSGIIGLICGLAAAGAYARTFNKVFGVIYLLVGILGLFGVFMTLLSLNAADNWLHIVIGLVTAGVGFFAK